VADARARLLQASDRVRPTAIQHGLAAHKSWTDLMHGLGLPTVDVEYSGTTKRDLFPRCVCLLREEHVSLFHFGDNVRSCWISWLGMLFAVDHLTHLDEVG
jgi:hypothetical protein